MKIKARFIGSKDSIHSMGFNHGETYELKTEIKRNLLFIYATKNNLNLYCVYENMESFLENWVILREEDSRPSESIDINNVDVYKHNRGVLNDFIRGKQQRNPDVIKREIKERIREIKFIKTAELYAEEDEIVDKLLRELGY